MDFGYYVYAFELTEHFGHSLYIGDDSHSVTVDQLAFSVHAHVSAA